jgi:DNA adenine methylase
MPFVDVFMGSLNVVRHAKRPRYAFDANLALVTMYAAALAGWDPPRTLSESDYLAIKASPDPRDPITAFAMIGCSFGAKWGGGYARSHDPKDKRSRVGYASTTREHILEKVRACRDLIVRHCDYREIPDFGPGAVLYLDPPYEGTTGYAGVGPFDHRAFWPVASQWALDGKLVFVSEGEAAAVRPGWVVFREWWTPMNMPSKDKVERTPRVERLLVHESSPMAAHPSSFHRLAERARLARGGTS